MNEQELDMLVAELDRENRLMRARNERLVEELNNLKSTVARALRSLEALAPDSAPVIRILASAVSDFGVTHVPPEDTEGGAV